ncbi:DDB1- and CUL4-associated factor 4 like protein [Argiope bruennichi]|uniref:DDB1- and CUL4-associated factor 4 like protein n=1 Tax=Argiope bruennichi TaxID=94029 RepID=A0A8T0EDB0_ARGBR|nr:DDB1- and CUL4-associated factor 4 like protein [Argiope bruennichi]
MANMINETSNMSGCEENIIDIESDVSTITSNIVSDSETKYKRNYVNMSDLKSDSLLNKKTRKSNILELISEQRTGNKPNYVFNSNMAALKNSRLKSTNCLNTVHPELHVSDCEYIRSGQDGRSILGVWKGDQYDTILYKLILNLSPRESSVEDDTPSFIKSIKHMGPFFSRTDIKDICDTNYRNMNHVLYVGSYSNEDFITHSSVVLCSFINSSAIAGRQFVSLKELLSCCGSFNGDVYATGSEEGVIIYQDQEAIFHNHSMGRINSLEFNSSGNILYCGVNNVGIIIIDRRVPQMENCIVQDRKYSSGILEIKLFSNENSMIVSDTDGNLRQIDLRKRETVFSYSGHVGATKKIPFSLNEQADLLCATGTDKLTRLWSLRTGSHMCTVEPQIKSTKVHSCLIADECRWSVAIFQKNKVFIMEPDN